MRSAISTLSKILLVIVAIPFALIAKLVSTIFGLNEKLPASKVATILRNFLEGGGGDWDWDDFTSLPLANPKLEDIRRRAAEVELPLTNEGLATVRGLLAEAEHLERLEAQG